jgi:metal-dependent amidase/aminoacylase/carboxypeptidase family protein
MMQRVQEQGGKAVFMRQLTPMAGPAHNRRYDFNEEVLVTATQIYAACALDLLSK